MPGRYNPSKTLTFYEVNEDAMEAVNSPSTRVGLYRVGLHEDAMTAFEYLNKIGAATRQAIIAGTGLDRPRVNVAMRELLAHEFVTRRNLETSMFEE